MRFIISFLISLMLIPAIGVRAEDSTSIVSATTYESSGFNMQENAITNIGVVGAGKLDLSSVFVVGDICEIGEIGRDSNGHILSCIEGTWQRGGSDFGGRDYAQRDFQYIPGGLIMQWDTVTVSHTTDYNFTFPIPFPNDCLKVSFGQWNSGYGTAVYESFINIVSKDRFGITLRNTWVGDSNGTRRPVTVEVFAIGY